MTGVGVCRTLVQKSLRCSSFCVRNVHTAGLLSYITHLAVAPYYIGSLFMTWV